MVRQLQPTETGLPMELYFFTDTVVWVDYERIQSDVFDHVLAVIPEFDLRVFQNPSGSDIEALRYHAASIVLVHNHPSGDPTPSAEDRRTTVRIQEAGAMLGIRLLDHVIIGEQAYFSFKERGILSL